VTRKNSLNLSIILIAYKRGCNPKLKRGGKKKMAVKMMQREVTFTKVEYAHLKVVEGQPTVTKETMVFAGNIDEEKALKFLTKDVGSGVTVLSTEVDSQIYEMPVTDFIQLATIKKEKEVKEKPQA
jgi:hypothetical protein